MRSYLMCDMSIIPRSRRRSFRMSVLAINTNSYLQHLGSEPKHIPHQGQTHDWCAFHLYSPPEARITLDLNNSSQLLVFSIMLTLRLRPLLNWKNLGSPGNRFFLGVPLNMQTDAITIKGNCSCLKRLCRAAAMLHLGSISRLDWCHSNTPLHLEAVLKICCCLRSAAGIRDA